MVSTKGKESVYSIRVFQTRGKYRIVGVVRDRIKFALRNKLYYYNPLVLFSILIEFFEI